MYATARVTNNAEKKKRLNRSLVVAHFIIPKEVATIVTKHRVTVIRPLPFCSYIGSGNPTLLDRKTTPILEEETVGHSTNRA